MEELERELVAAAAAARYYAKRNYVLGYLVAGVTVVASIAAGLTAALTDYKAVTGALASLPAAMVTASTVFRFEPKSGWFWQKAKALEALLRAIRFEGLGLADASQRFSDIEVNMERNWIGFGSVNSKQ